MGKASKSKRQKTEAADLITSLPRHVIDVITDHLPLHDAARMSVLSHKWLDIWRSTPKLAFDAQFFKQFLKNRALTVENMNQFYNIVSKILLQRHSGCLLHFHVDIPNIGSFADVNQWIFYLSRNGVSDVCIQIQYPTPYKLSSHIFSCINLEKLKLQSYIISPPRNFSGFKKMTCLELDKTSLTSKNFENLIQGSPLLQELRLTNFIGLNNIQILAPNLCHLVVDGSFKKLYVRNAQNLVSAAIGLQKRANNVRHKDALRVLLLALATSSKLHKLGFRGHFLMTIYGMVLPAPTFDKLKNLDLSAIHLTGVDEFCSVISIIQNCPAIESLNISVSTSKNETEHLLEYNSSFVLQHLCYASVEIVKGSNMELRLIEFLLKCSPFLKMLSITASSGNSNSTFTQSVMFQLISFYRASQNVKIRCLPPVVDDSSDSDSDHWY